MGTFYTSCDIVSIVDRGRSIRVDKMLVDTGGEHTWVSGKLLETIGVAREKKDLTFVMANGAQITRSMGFAVVRCEEFFTIDEVVFSEEGDMSLLGARSMEGFNARVDPSQKRLVAAGPIPAAGLI
jgi:predicted aspartyl protease